MNVVLKALITSQNPSKDNQRVYLRLIDRETQTEISASCRTKIDEKALQLPIIITSAVDVGAFSYRDKNSGEQKTLNKFEFIGIPSIVLDLPK